MTYFLQEGSMSWIFSNDIANWRLIFLTSSLHACILNQFMMKSKYIRRPQHQCDRNEYWVKICFKILFNFNYVMLVCIYVCMWMCILAPKKVRPLNLLVARIIRRCKRPDLVSGNEIFLIVQPCLYPCKYFKASVYQLEIRK